uniref:O-fucosyltransferase family protein n=1 Tax=Aegilops tauschii TaxID=37682 RepID=M8BSS2_AEGTA
MALESVGAGGSRCVPSASPDVVRFVSRPNSGVDAHEGYREGCAHHARQWAREADACLAADMALNEEVICVHDSTSSRSEKGGGCGPSHESRTGRLAVLSHCEVAYCLTTQPRLMAILLTLDVPPENETSGYIFIHAEGGLNQQRIAICNAVAIAKIMEATLILPVLKQDQIWKDQTKFEDIFDVDHFINYLKDDVRIVRDIPDWFTEKDELFTSIKRTVKNIPKYASAQFYIDNVLPRIKEKTIMSIKPFVDRLGYDNVPMEINRLRCRVNYHALKFLPDIEEMADKLATKMRNRTSSGNPYMALHLRYEKGMVGLSFCDFAGTREEKVMMAAYRQKEWPRRFKNGSHLWPLALQKRKEGRCPLEPGEIAVILRALGYTRETQIYVASGQVYGGKNRMAPLRNMFPNLVTKEELASTAEMEHFRKHVTSLAALDFLVCLKSDVFVMTHGGNFAKLIMGARRYSGRHRLKSIKPDKGLMSKSLGDPYLAWASFAEDVVISHQARAGLPEPTFPGYDLWENPLTPCMCRA